MTCASAKVDKWLLHYRASDYYNFDDLYLFDILFLLFLVSALHSKQLHYLQC